MSFRQYSAMLCRGSVLAILFISAGQARATESEHAMVRSYALAPAAPLSQSAATMQAGSVGCLSCHSASDSKTMHDNPAVKLSCTDCHGGDASVTKQAGSQAGDDSYIKTLEAAHVLPLFPHAWHFPASANPQQTYTLLNRESPQFIRFINPSDYRVARAACGACHLPIIQAAESSLMATSAMLWGGASYNNGILPYKRYILGEAYTAAGEPAKLLAPITPTPAMTELGILPELNPLPAWETVMPGDIFRAFERGGRNISTLFPETGLPNALGQQQRLEEPGRPDFHQSNRGPGTGARISVPVLNLTKTRLNDPHTWFMGTNDQPGDYRHSGCASCHVVYANDRDPRHAGPYAAFGNSGESQTLDPTIAKHEPGHPLRHQFTRAIPTSQCMSCHMHQPNMFMNSFLGYTMWDYEADAPAMWPAQQAYPDAEAVARVARHNPEAAAARGNWGDVEFLKDVSSLNPQLKDTQFADYHGHGWNFRAVFKRDRKGNLLDAEGGLVSDDDPEKFSKAVHMSSIHLDKGMHCVDCHYGQDNHGNGHLYGEVAAAIEIDCRDCHGTAQAYPGLYTSGPAALDGGTDLGAIRNPDGRKRFEWVGDKLLQRSVLDPQLEWEVSLVKDSVNPAHPAYNAKAARAKLMSTDVHVQSWGQDVPIKQLAHGDEDMECYSCHTSWTTSCAGCHLPIEANQKADRKHYEGGATRNLASYNPQVSRDDMFLLGRHSTAKGGKIAPVRSTSALVLSSTNANREKIYIQQPPIAASGFSSQAFNPHFPHTVRTTETKQCEDCHLSRSNDNNAVMAQLLMFGTRFVDFVGHFAWVGGQADITAVKVTEWDEPQAVIGSYLHRYAYPDFFAQHLDRHSVLQEAYSHDTGAVNCLQLRGEYLFVAEGERGMAVYDVASIANKGVSQRIISAPFSLLGQDIRVASDNASCVILPTTQPIAPARNSGELMRAVNAEQAMHPLYNYAFVTDSREGLILVDVNTLVDGEPRNNNLSRALTWNAKGVLAGARHMVLGGYHAYVIADAGLVVLNLDQPLAPVVEAILPLNKGHSLALQFRYLFVTDADGLKVIDVTAPSQPRLVDGSVIALATARRIHLARTYAYVAAGADGIAIVDIERPEKIGLVQKFTGDGQLRDSYDITLGSTNASLFAYVADGVAGLKVLQLTSPSSQPKFYGFSPEPVPELIASYPTPSAALSLSRGLERDRGVDETGGQIAVFGRLGARPFNEQELKKLYLDNAGKPWFVENK